MDIAKHLNLKLAGMVIIMILILQACSSPPAVSTQIIEVAQPTATEEGCQVVHVVTPPEPSTTRDSSMNDREDTLLVSQHRAFSGSEWFDKDIYERPFTPNVMDYLPDIDIVKAQLSRSGDWVFITLLMSGQNTAGGMQGAYGIEVDNNIDGRGDFLIYGVAPTDTSWTSTGVKAYEDTNQDVGGITPIIADVSSGSGYDTLVFDEGCINDPDAAWIRISPSSASTVQLAFKWALIKNNGIYLWGAWAGLPEMLNPAWFDYNDHFTHAIAGSPLTELTDYYPLKAFWGWDNTCRWIVGQKNSKRNRTRFMLSQTTRSRRSMCTRL